MKLTGFVAGVLFAASRFAAAAEAGISNGVAVLDFSFENSTAEVADWTVGLADFVEVALQKENVPTLERRQIRLILGERDLQSRGLLQADTLRAAKLPTVSYFVVGHVSREAANGFTLTFSAIRADTAVLEFSVTRNGFYPADWLPSINSLARDVSSRLGTKRLSQPARSEFETLTWLPEAALPFFKGLQYYAQGDHFLAEPWFRHAYDKEQHFDEARLWEARAYRQAGLPKLAEIALRPVKHNPATGNAVAAKLPVVAVVASPNVSASGRAAFVQALAQSGRFQPFEPASIGATAREIDLQLTGQLAAPLNERSVWLVIDSLIFLDSPTNSVLRSRQNELLSGKLIRESRLSVRGEPGVDAFTALAKEFLKIAVAGSAKSSLEQGSSTRDLSEPTTADSPEVSFAKALRLAATHPDRARLLVGLSDYYSEWSFRSSLLDEGVAAIERDRDQADAAFWLASALWRKREMSRRVYFIPDAPPYTETSLTNDFARLLEWFPDSTEAHTLAETNRRSGIFVYSMPTDRRYLAGVFTNVVGWKGLLEIDVRRASVPAATDEQRLTRLREYRRDENNARAWLLASALCDDAEDPDVRAEAQRARDELLKVAIQEDSMFNSFSAALERKQFDRAWEIGRSLLNCIFRNQRLAVMEKCGEMIKQTNGFVARFDFMFEQAEKYKGDFNFDPDTGAPETRTVTFRLEGNPVTATWWASSSPDLEYARLMGELAEETQARKRPDLSAKLFEAIRRNEALPLQNRLTATYDLAAVRRNQKNDFEALELLKELLRQTEGTGTPQARKTSRLSVTVESAAFDLLRKIRLYTGADADICRCCGDVRSPPLPKPENMDEMNHFLGELWKEFKGGVGGDNRAVKKRLLEQKDAVLPVILYKLQKGEDAQQMLIFCGALGTNSASALPYITRYACESDPFPFTIYGSALAALAGIGKPAVCAMPLLIVASEGQSYVFNAKAALERIGTAHGNVVPYLAKLLYHKNTAICEKAARAIADSGNLNEGDFAGKSGEQLILSVRKWWEDEGIEQDWSKP
jgi:hypothetical protein